MKKPLIFILIGVILICGAAVLVLVGKNVITDFSGADQSEAAEETEIEEFAGYEEIDVENIDRAAQVGEDYEEALDLIRENLANGWTEYAPVDAGLSAAFSDTSLQFAYYMDDLNEDGYDELLLGIQDGSSFKIVQFVTVDESGLMNSLFTGNDQRYLVALQDGIYAEYGYSTELVIGEEDPEESENTAAAPVPVAAWTFTDGTLKETDLPESMTEEPMVTAPLN